MFVVCIMGLKPSPLGETFTCKFSKKKKRNTKLEVKKVEHYRKSSHCTYDMKYHIVWITKYRKPVLRGPIAERTRELIRIICATNDAEIMAGHVGTEHIHLLVSVPPHLTASKLVQYIKGSTSHKLQMEYKELNKQHWGEVSMGKRIFCSKQRECNRRGNLKVYTVTGLGRVQKERQL